MIDLHCHILPGLDDGAFSMEESLGMARLMLADGVTHVVATPHFNPGMCVERARVLDGVVRLSRELERAGVPLTVLPGSEVMVTRTSDYRAQLEARQFCHLGDGDEYTLLEFSWTESAYPCDAPVLMSWLVERGITPLVAHPERQAWSSDAGRVLQLVEAGAWLQINADSLTGSNGPGALRTALELVRGHENVVLSSDSHNLDRCSGITPGLDVVRARFGPERADDVVARAERVLAALRLS